MRSIQIRLLTVVGFATVGVVSLANMGPRVVTNTQRRDPVYAGLVGHWQGTVEERDPSATSLPLRRFGSRT